MKNEEEKSLISTKTPNSELPSKNRRGRKRDREFDSPDSQKLDIKSSMKRMSKFVALNLLRA